MDAHHDAPVATRAESGCARAPSLLRPRAWRCARGHRRRSRIVRCTRPLCRRTTRPPRCRACGTHRSLCRHPLRAPRHPRAGGAAAPPCAVREAAAPQAARRCTATPSAPPPRARASGGTTTSASEMCSGWRRGKFVRVRHKRCAPCVIGRVHIRAVPQSRGLLRKHPLNLERYRED